MNNPDELAGLPEEVKHAVESARRLARTLPLDQRTAFEALIDGILDLTRQKLDLARENAELREARDEIANRQLACGMRAERADAELAALKLRNEELRDQFDTRVEELIAAMDAADVRTQEAYAKLAEIQRKIGEAPRTVIPVEDDGSGIVGKRVALLPVGGE